ncbi:metallopeptidase family protein [Jatrophihabitans endophyticus]|uniref:metallopeptidase family protein n=1 Tax=Jatrophihabitans endophyticus TaxID=1206085 RepID=UPI00093237DD
MEVDRHRFEDMVGEALDTLPAEFTRLMRNVVVQVEDAPPDGPGDGLFGLYEGVPLTERMSDYSAVLPDRITIFRLATLAACDSEAEVVAEVRTTVVHEVGHHFGIDDDRLHELGY